MKTSVICALIMAVIPGLVDTAVAATQSEPTCVVTVSTLPSMTAGMSEGDTLPVVVTLRYTAGPEATVRLLARNLPEFILGWDNKSAFCRDCTIQDTVCFVPGYCDRGVYEFEFVGMADIDPPYGEDIVTVHEYVLTVEDADRGCTLRLDDSVMAIPGESIRFSVAADDPDARCPDHPDPVWRFSGYPFNHGAVVTDAHTFRPTITWTPTGQDYGRHEVIVNFAYGPSACRDTMYILVPPYDTGCVEEAPYIVPEPEFTAGTSNTITYLPMCGAYEHEVCYFDFEDSDNILGCRWEPNKSITQSNMPVQVLIEGLEDGVTYGYFVTAYFLDPPETDTSLSTSSTQDASPPERVKGSAIALAGGVIEISWGGVKDRVSYVDYYKLYRRTSGGDHQLQAIIPVDPDSNDVNDFRYTYYQSLGDGSGLIEGMPYHYMVTAVDAVGNEGEGAETPAVVPDSTPPCIPDVSIDYDYYFFPNKYIGTATCDVLGESNCTGLEEAHLIMFQAARDSLKYFDVDYAPDTITFTSDTLDYEMPGRDYTFDFTPPDGDITYVHGHTYLVRAQAFDRYRNASGWSKPKTVIVDLLPPDDISNLTAVVDLDYEDSTSMVTLSWLPATDGYSGLDYYTIYRSVNGGDYVALDIVDAPGYVDTDLSFGMRVELCYRVGSTDHVGHSRDYTQTEWTACVRPPVAPIIAVECDIDVPDECYTGFDSVRIFWTDYIADGVDHYVALSNGAEYVQPDASADHMFVPTPDDMIYTIKVRAVFINGTVSEWSNEVSVHKDGAPPDSIDSLWIDDTEAVAYLRWNEPFDSTGIKKYYIYGLTGNEKANLLDSTAGNIPEWPISWTDENECTVYEESGYAVHPVDLLENEQDAGNAELMTYCRRPPVIDTVTLDGDGVFHISWSRAMPNLSAYWLDSVCVIRKSTVGGSISTHTVKFAIVYDSACTYYDTVPGYYCCQVKEVALDLDGNPSSIWSEPICLPYEYNPPGVTSVDSFPQPVPEADTGNAVGEIYLLWDHDNQMYIAEYKVIRCNGGICDTFIYVPDPLDDSCVFVDTGLFIDIDYSYEVIAVDIFGIDSDSSAKTTAAIKPYWQYTPYSTTYGYISQPTLNITWNWIDYSGALVDNAYGAIACSVEVSVDSMFSVINWSHSLVPADDTLAVIELDPTILGSIRPLYYRIKAQDRFGNWSPWSNEYDDWPHKVIYDIIPPYYDSAADSLTVNTIADSSTNDSFVYVSLVWPPADDEGSGVESYRIYIDRGTGWSLDTSTNWRETAYVQAEFPIVGIPDGAYIYAVVAVDSAGNEQDKTKRNMEPLPVIMAPTNLSANSYHDITWSTPEQVDSFNAECAINKDDLGTVFMKLLDEDCRIWINDPEAEFAHFKTNSDFDYPSSGAVHFHIKAIRDGNESPWSAVNTYPPDTAAQTSSNKPIAYALDQNYPNPFNPSTSISFSLPKAGHVRLTIFNIVGERVVSLIDDNIEAGIHTIVWTGTDCSGNRVASGIYLYRLQTADYTQTRRMILLR